MKLSSLLPSMGAWASAVTLFFYAMGVSVTMVLVMPLIAELMRHSPRLGWLAMLAVWLAPIGVAGAAHYAGHKLLDLGDVRAEAVRARSTWAGFVAWAAILVVTLTTSLVMLVIDPPPVDPGELWGLARQVSAGGVLGVVRAAVWVVLAAYVYTLERVARRDV
jgi:hypothetical protein